MKRKLSMLILCSILLVTTVEIVIAGNPDYALIEHISQEPATIDGQWTDDEEWTDSWVVEVSDNFNFAYILDYDTMAMSLCVEIFDDDTDDAGDYWQICFDDGDNGGSTPQTNDFRIDIVGHTDLVVYEGNGDSWNDITSDIVEGEIEWANTVSDSPAESTPHWTLEIDIIKTTRMAVNPPPCGLRVAVYDASNSEAGVQDWAPDGDVDDPDTWGLVADYDLTTIPEGLTFGVMALLSSISLLAGSHYLHKRSKKRETV
jgi:hypothetical protein